MCACACVHVHACMCACACACLREVEDGGVDEHLVGVGVAVQRARDPRRGPDRRPLRRRHGGGGGGGGGAVKWRSSPPHDHVGAWKGTGQQGTGGVRASHGMSHGVGQSWCGRSSVGARSTFEWRPVTVEAEVLHAEVLLEHAPVSRPRWLSLRPAGAPEAPSLSGSARLGLPRAAASRGRSAPWAALGSLVRVGLHCVGRALDTGARGCARATSDAKSGRWAGVSHRHTSMAEYEGGCGSGGESRSISAISAAEAKPSTTPRTHAPKHLLG